MRHTKIIATAGPATRSDEVLDAIIAAGANIIRLNFSHGTHATQAATYQRVRSAARRVGQDVAIMQDLGGPKIRTGLLKDGRPLQLRSGDSLTIATGDFVGDLGRVATTFAGLARTAAPGDRLLLADGAIQLRVESTNGRELKTVVLEGGQLGEHKGINAPGVPLPASSITAKDVDDLKFGLTLGVDCIALSFVQSSADVRQARQLLAENGGAGVPLIAKLERPQALEHLDEIIQACDAVMVARGDLGLEMPLERVPRAQKEITRRARHFKTPVILATQVLESMTTGARPTRAEVSDAANAVDDGVDAIMLAGETAAGAFPAKAVQTLDAVIRDAESVVGGRRSQVPRGRDDHDHDHAQAICEAAVTLAEGSDAQAIVAITRGGGTARRLSALRPRVQILAATEHEEVARRLAVYWGVSPVVTDVVAAGDTAGVMIGRQLVARGLVAAGTPVVLVSINDDLTRLDANYLKIQRL